MIKVNLKNQKSFSPLMIALMALGAIAALFIHWILLIGLLVYIFWYILRFSSVWLATFSFVIFFFGVVTLLSGLSQLANVCFGLVFVLLTTLLLIRLTSENSTLEVSQRTIKEDTKKRNFNYIIINVLMVSGYILVFNVIPETSLLWHMTFLGSLIVFANFIVWQYEITK